MVQTFFWKSFLILALEQPVSLDIPGGNLWISSKEHLQVQAQPGSVTLLPTKKGLLFISGTKNSETKPQAVVVTTAANLSALKKCPHFSEIEISEGNLIYAEKNFDSFSTACGFDDLHIGENHSVSEKVRNLFYKNEKHLITDGLTLGLAKWENGKRQLIVNSSSSEDQIKAKMPAPLRPFYEIEVRNQFTPGKNLIFELTLFEFSRQRARSLGLKWPQSISLISVDPKGKTRQFMQETSRGSAQEIQLAADFGESQGVGRVLAQPTLRTQAGIESRFLSGGEFPVKNSNAFQSQTAWKSYGLKIALTPNAQSKAGDTEVSVDFKLEFSEPNMDNVVEGIPSLIQRQLESRFDVRTNETTVLTTMVTLREGRGRAGLAFLSQIPLLSLLFAQNVDTKNNSELWFALRPTWEEIQPRNALPARFENSQL